MIGSKETVNFWKSGIEHFKAESKLEILYKNNPVKVKDIPVGGFTSHTSVTVLINVSISWSA